MPKDFDFTKLSIQDIVSSYEKILLMREHYECDDEAIGN